MNKNHLKHLLIVIALLCSDTAFCQTDTLRIMGYNVLYYGNGCQGPNELFHNYLKKIVSFTNPDVLSMEKMASIPLNAADKYGTAPVGFADSILQYALNAAYPGRYAYCPYTNEARANNVALLCYNQHKLGFVAIVASYVNVTDFNTYKLYYKDPNLAKTHDTTFLYITMNHDKSGDEFEEVRAQQIAGEMKGIRSHFTHLPNFINIGDFNVRTSKERFYQLLTQNPDTGFRFCDPPFFPDRKLKYPADWDHEGMYAAYFTTSTRMSASIPNSCGSGGGGKNWYDHIFISNWLVNNTNYMQYIPNSYRTIGNDGQRFRISINNNNSHTNTSAPADVIDALYHMSNKYPVMIDLLVTANTTGVSVADPEVYAPVAASTGKVTYTLATATQKGRWLTLTLPEELMGQEINVAFLDKNGNEIEKDKFTVKETTWATKIKAEAGTYTLKITGKHNLILEERVEY